MVQLLPQVSGTDRRGEDVGNELFRPFAVCARRDAAPWARMWESRDTLQGLVVSAELVQMKRSKQ